MAIARQRRRFWFVFGAVIVVILSIPIVRGLIGRSLLFVGRPLIIAGQSITDYLRLSSSSKQTVAERDALRQKVDDLTARLYEANQQLETVQVVDSLNIFQAETKRTVMRANVIALSPDPGVQSIVIDRGSNDGLRIGQVIITDHGYVVGKIMALHQVTSTVLLLTDRQSKISARIQNKEQSAGIVEGERGLTLSMSFIPKNDPVSNGQTVVTSGTEEGIPPDLLIGTISSVTTKTSELFQQALLAPAASLQRLRVVAVIVS